MRLFRALQKGGLSVTSINTTTHMRGLEPGLSTMLDASNLKGTSFTFVNTLSQTTWHSALCNGFPIECLHHLQRAVLKSFRRIVGTSAGAPGAPMARSLASAVQYISIW